MDNDIKQVDEKLPDTWELVPFKKVVSVLPDGSKRVKKRNYLETGKIPVIDQGQDYIGGFTDDESMTFTGELPVVLFGDHTKSIKFVKRPFAVGADGIKILKPASSYNIKFFFYLLHSLQIPDRGYSRHFQFLKKFDLPFAPPDEQKRIVAEIEKQFPRLDEAVGNLKRVKGNLKRYKASVLKAAVEGKLTEAWRKKHPDVEPADKLLERILVERLKKWEEAELAKMKAKGKAPKDDKWKKKYKEPAKPDLKDLPVLPKEWKWVTWDTILEFDKGAFKRGPFGSSLKKPIFVDSGYKVYEQYCPINDDCSFARYYITDEKYNELKAFAVQAKDFLISCSGVTLGRITQVPDEYDAGVINQALLRVRLNNNIFDDSFFIMLFRSPYFQKQIFKNATGSAIPNVKGVNELKAIPLPLLIFNEQREIVAILEEYMSFISEIDRQVDKNLKRASRLRQSILKKAFSGQLVSSANEYESGINHELPMAAEAGAPYGTKA